MMTTGKNMMKAFAVGFAAICMSTVASATSLDELKADYKRPDSIPFPEDNPFSEAKAELGKALFFDPRLSGDNTMSCATCHNPSFGWEDGLALGIGMEANALGRHTPTIFDLAWGELFFWDGRSDSLEAQALGPIESSEEMMQSLPELVEELNQIEGYKPMLMAAFDTDKFTQEIIAKSIATYERTVVSPISPFDRWVDGDENAISDAAKRGFELFNDKANCAACHDTWTFTDSGFHDIGLDTKDRGRGKLLGDSDFDFAFKTPGLREISARAPYMHNGSIATLRGVVEHYNNGSLKRPTQSDDVFDLDLTDSEIDDIVAFMETLDGERGKRDLVEMPVLPH